MVIEKAWAKLHGSFEKIEAKDVSQTMQEVTGAPAEHYDLNHK